GPRGFFGGVGFGVGEIDFGHAREWNLQGGRVGLDAQFVFANAFDFADDFVFVGEEDNVFSEFVGGSNFGFEAAVPCGKFDVAVIETFDGLRVNGNGEAEGAGPGEIEFEAGGIGESKIASENIGAVGDESAVFVGPAVAGAASFPFVGTVGTFVKDFETVRGK